MQIVQIDDATVNGEVAGEWTAQAGRNYVNTIYVETDSKLIGPSYILSNIGIKVGDTYRFPLYSAATERDPKSYIQRAHARRSTEDGLGWYVTLEYGPFNATEQGGAGDDGKLDPTKIPPKVRTGTAKYEVGVIYDTQTGKAVLNTAGMPPEPSLTRPASNSVWTIVRNEASWDGSLEQYADHVNLNPFLGFEPNTVKVNDISAEREYQADFGYYWVVTYEFEIRPIIYALDSEGNPIMEDTGLPPPNDVGGPVMVQNGWTERIRSSGVLQKSSDGTTLEQIIIDGIPVSQAVQLDESGRYDPNAEPVYIDVNRFPSLDFAVFNIPDDLLTQAPPDAAP